MYTGLLLSVLVNGTPPPPKVIMYILSSKLI